ncbi:MAG: protein-disulfide reductase DsbD [Betaproteobacteria bacterium]|nr:protein-disulfide reductase DsbD [Betaproteobacteria bacterium]
MLAFCALAAPTGAQGSLFGKQADLLEPEKAFAFSARAVDDHSIEVRFDIAPGYYLYRERFRFAIENGGAARLGAPVFPRGEKHKDEFFGEMETYRKQVRIRLPVEAAAPGSAVELNVTSQGCADAGICYVPMDSRARIVLAAAPGPSAPELSTAPDEPLGAGSRFSLFASDREIARLFEGNALLVVAGFLGFGLLLAFTPCVLPMIPILSGIIAGEGRRLNKGRGLALSLSYVLGMAVAYAAAGVAAAFSGTLLAAALQNAWVLGAFALVFVALALSMFGWYDLQLPQFLHRRAHAAHSRLEGGRIASVAAMGVLSAIIVSPCVAAPLAGALLYISQTRDVALGGAALFAMALGMGLPLIVVGVSEGAFLPKSGPWLNRVKQVFGVLLLAVAVWIVWPVLAPGGGEVGFVRVASNAELEAKLLSAGKPAMLDFYADWCVSCKEMEKFTFSDPAVRQKLDGMLLLQADVTANSAEHKALLKRFSLFGPPGIIFFDAQGREIKGLRVIGYQNAERFVKTLDLATAP